MSPHSTDLPMAAELLDYQTEGGAVFSLGLRLLDQEQRDHYHFHPGQFNMVGVHGLGEVAISIVEAIGGRLQHTIRAVGRVTTARQRLRPGAVVGIRGPLGRGWPLSQLQGRDLVVVTGGLGCAPVVSAITAIARERDHYGRLVVLEGVRHHQDLLFPQRFEQWQRMDRTEVVLCCSHERAAPWPWHTDRVTDHLQSLGLALPQAAALLCGPEGMMVAAAQRLQRQGMDPSRIWLSLERNMQCGNGRCGHCQLGSYFVCRDGPVFHWGEIGRWLQVAGL